MTVASSREKTAVSYQSHLLHMVKFSAQTRMHCSAERLSMRPNHGQTAGTAGKAARDRIEKTSVANMEQLEAKVDELIELCAVLSRENRALRAQQQNWSAERAKLIEKNELAKSRVESMITRLKTLEQD